MQYGSPAPHPVNLRLLSLVCAVYLLTGLLDHDLWKYQDAVHLGVTWDMAQNGLQHGHWMQPHLAGERWDEGPLYYWFAAVLGQLLSGLLGFHNAARLATTLFGAITLYVIGRTSALTLAGTQSPAQSRFDAAAPLLLIGAPGILIPLHEAQPMIAVLAAHALTYWGVAMLPQRRSGALLMALGLGVAVLAGGLDTLFPLAALLLLPLVSRQWRSSQALSGLVLGGLLGAATIAAIAARLPLPSIDPFQPTADRDHFELLAWYSWPALPIGLWAVWLHRRRLDQIALPLVGSFGALIWFLLYSDSRNLPALPMLLPLVMLGATGAGRLRRGAANALDWFGMMTFTLFGVFLWLSEIAMLTGMPPKMHHNIMRLIPGYDHTPSLLAWGFAAVISVLWILIIVNSRRSSWRGINTWACGVVLLWCLFAAMWIPPVDYGKSYGPFSQALAAKLGHQPGANTCVASRNLGEAQRAALDYHIGLITRRGHSGETCDWLLVQATAKHPPSVGTEWRRVWDGARPSDRDDRYYLYKR